MTRDWKTGKQIENAHYCWKDPILKDEFGITEEDWDDTIQRTVEHIRNAADETIAGRVSCILGLLLPSLQTLWQGKNCEHPFRFRWLPCKSLKGATVADYSLTASAIAYCLGYEEDPRPDSETLDRLRLSAMTATWVDDELGAVHDALWAEHAPIEPKADGDNLERIVFLAKTVASERICPDKVDFSTHPLKDEKRQVGLVLGGATKIKGYFLESARLPEIRGASALLDRINLEDVPSIFGCKSDDRDPQRLERIRQEFTERTKHSLSAPECVIYAAGGNTLAFSPVSVVHKIADEIERIYTKETLVANSVAVGDTFDLLELQYGLNPTRLSGDGNLPESKCFGELTTKLAQAQLHRREGNPTSERTERKTRRDLPTHVEIGPYQQRCTSCERRPVVINEPRILCEACTRKYVTGLVSKKNIDDDLDRFLKVLGGWRPSNWNSDEGWRLINWSSLFENYLKVTEKVNCYVDTIEDLKKVDGPQRLKTIAEASKPQGFITFIYADGNNMGGYLEKVKTPAEYRQFSERVFIALQKAAFDALAKHLTPTDAGIHPFEIVSIGGDDLLLIVPGSKAFDVVHAIGKNFDEQFNSYSKYSKFTETEKDKLRKSQRYTSDKWVDEQEMQPAFSLSLGFVIADEHTPVGFLEHFADSLLRSAKARAKTLKKSEIGYLGGTVDFLVLKSFSMITSELSDFRKKFYKTDTKNSLTMHPFTLHELSGFIKTIQAFRKGGFPRSQLYQLQQSLRLGQQTSTLDYLYFRSRLKEGNGELLQAELERNWQGAPNVMDGQGPWYAMLNDDTRYETLLFDIIEAYDFIPKEEGSSDESSD